MALNVENQNNKFRVITQGFETEWLPDTPENRKVVVVMLRVLQDQSGKPLFTLEEIAAVVGSDNRQAADNHIEKFRECGENFEEFLKRKRKVDEEVVKAVEEVLQSDPLQKPELIARAVNEKLGREDITAANVQAALEQISSKELRKILKKQLEKGEVHYKEEYLLNFLFGILLETSEDTNAAPRLPEGIEKRFNNASEAINANQPASPQPDEVELPENVKPLFEGEVNSEKLLSIWDSTLGWKLLAFILYFHGVSQSTIGGWFGVNKSTICRWLSNVASWASPYLKGMQVSFSGRAGVDEKMIKIGNCWWYLFVAVDCVTGYPLHLALYPSNNGDYCKLFLLEFKRSGFIPIVIITDGWDAYIKAIQAVFPDAEHLLCRFHVIRSIFRRLRKAKIFATDIWQATGKLFKTHYKRTVQRRIDRLKAMLHPIEAVQRILGGLEIKLPQVLQAIGSTWRPSTANAAEQFFGRFDRFYRLKGPFQNEASARKHIDLFLLGYLFTIGSQGQPCPLEKACQDVVEIPFYHLINRPNLIALKDRIAQQYRAAS